MTTRTEFDFETAWQELPLQEFPTLSQDARDLFAFVVENGAEWAQDRWLEVPFPSPEVRAKFDGIPVYELARAARCVYFLGHWKPGNVRQLFGDTCPGAAWKFSNLADQALADRLGVPRNRIDAGPGVSRRIHEGTLRVCISGRDFWTWREVGLAHKDTLEAVNAVPYALPRTRAEEQRWNPEPLLDQFEEAGRLAEPGSAFDWSTKRFMVPEGTWSARRDAEREAAAAKRRYEIGLATHEYATGQP